MNRFLRTLTRIGGPGLTLLALAFTFTFTPARGEAQPPRNASRLFAREAAIETDGSLALTRLPIPASILSEIAPDFSDVRVFSAEGEEQPYLVESGARSASLETFTVVPTHAERWIDEDETVAFQFHERFEVTLPQIYDRPTRWTLIVGSTATRLVRNVVVRTTGEAPVELARGTVFRFTDPVRERTTIELPVAAIQALPAGATLQIDIAGEEGYLEPSFEMRAAFAPVDATQLVLPLSIVSRTERDGITTLVLERPRGLEPTEIRISTSTAHFARRVHVRDDGPNRNSGWLADALVFRARELDGAEDLAIPIERANDDILAIEIVNDDSPPLADLRFDAVVEQPSLVFAGVSSQLTLRYGGGRARRPSYDLEALFPMVYGDISSLPEARLGTPRENPDFDDGPALAFAMHPGRTIVSGDFRHVAAMTLAPSREGLSIVHLPAALLATARADLADVRIVDAELRQWSYLRRPDTPLVVPVTIGAATGDGDPSIYEITMPVSLATVRELAVGVSDEYASRAYTVRGMRDGRWVELQEGNLYCDPRATDGCRHISTFEDVRVTALQLRIEDGDDAPLVLADATITIPRDALYVAAPAGEYRVFTGNLEVESPTYELTSAQALVLAVPGANVDAGEPSVNRDHREPAWYEAAGVGTWALWAVLIVAVLMLGLLTLRLSREPASEPAGSTPSGDAPPAADAKPDAEAKATEEPASDPVALGDTGSAVADAADESAPPKDGDDEPDGDSVDKKPVKF